MHRLIPLVDNDQQGELLGRLRGLRKKFAQEVGYLPPVVHICDNLALSPCECRILIKGAEVGRGSSQGVVWLLTRMRLGRYMSLRASIWFTRHLD